MARLHRMSRLGSVNEVAACLAAGENVNAISVHHFSALMIAAQQGQAAVTALLLQAGADVSLTHPNGRTALHLAACGGHLETVRLLVSHGANVNAASRGGDTPALEAAEFNRAEVVAYLHEKGADPDVRGRNNLTAGEWLAEGGGFGRLRRLSPRFAALTDPEKPPPATPSGEANVARMMAETPNADEFAAHHGRNTLIWSYGVYEYEVPARQAWARRVFEVIRSPELLEQCEEQWLTGDELEAARQHRARRQRIRRPPPKAT